MQNNTCTRETDAKKLGSKIKGKHTHTLTAQKKNDVRLEIVAGFGGGEGCRLYAGKIGSWGWC